MPPLSQSSKTVVEKTLAISIYQLKHFGFLEGYKIGDMSWNFGGDQIGIEVNINKSIKQVHIYYKIIDPQSEENKNFDYIVPLTSTPCRYGSKRWWFICQLYKDGKFCGRRVGVLYKGKKDDYFACRHCHDLTYKKRNINPKAKFFNLLRTFVLEKEIRLLESKIKKRIYKGNYTKKQLKLNRLYEEFERVSSDLPSFG